MELHLNMDCGEELTGMFENVDQLLMPILSYCNIACGFHAGTKLTMHKTVQHAIQTKVKIGAHPSFDDRANFGRIYMNLTIENLIDIIANQVYELIKILDFENAKLFHIKAHGALYNAAMTNEKEAIAIIEAVKLINPKLVIFAMDQSVLARLAQSEGMNMMYESFADRNYLDATTLVPRTHPQALHESENIIIEQILKLNEGEIKVLSGETYNVKSNTICLHSDHPKIFQTFQKLKELVK
ncbi:MAG TPA: LamB/YcsF family protein [Saprospiraceae bacterium]|nr:LamB/YcsF family protein [Saprospiraceae bacterium]